MSELNHSLNVSDWLSSQEGKLSVDVIETRDEIIVRSTIAGVKSEDIDISLSDDTLTIRGRRNHDCKASKSDQIHVQECHWGAFSRTIILPCAIDPNSADATLKRGVLTIRMKKVEMDKRVPVLELDDL